MSSGAMIREGHAKRFVALAVVAALYFAARLPQLSAAERDELCARFSFASQPLPELGRLDGAEARSVRDVHPSLERISSWVSSVGAAVALNDLDGDGLPNDVAYVDTRTDQVVVAPLPATGERFEAFVLDPGQLVYHAARTAPTGVVPCDVNEDGRTDMLVYYWGRTPIVFLREEQGALARDAYRAVDLADPEERWYTNAATFADVDGDGHHDLLIGNYFEDGAHILDAEGTGREHMHHSMSRAANGGRNRLLLWQRAADDGARFEEVEGALSEARDTGWTLGIAAADLDGDLLPELYFANDFGPDALLHNRSQPGKVELATMRGVKELRTPNSKVLGRDSFKGMGAEFGDLTGDGHFDIYVSNITAEYALQESQFLFASTGELSELERGVAPFREDSEALGLARSGWGWESRLADFDNDGVLEAIQATGFVKGETDRWPELQELAIGNDELISNPAAWARFQPGIDLCGQQVNPFFVRSESGRYYDVAAAVGLELPMVSRGIATADVDGDGDLDFALGNQWEDSFFCRNQSPATGDFLGLNLLLPIEPLTETRVLPGHPSAEARGSAAVGSIVRVDLEDGRELVSLVDGGNGHSGARSFQVHFGLGRGTTPRELPVRIAWRDRRGVAHTETHVLEPGWYTLLLGADSDGGAGGVR